MKPVLNKMDGKHKIFWLFWGGLLIIAYPVLGEPPLPPLEFADVIEDVRGGAEFTYDIHPDLPVYHFHLTGNNCIDRIDISRGNDTAIVQTLSIIGEEAWNPL